VIITRQQAADLKYLVLCDSVLLLQPQAFSSLSAVALLSDGEANRYHLATCADVRPS
jgi:hypothetical protein